MHAAQPDGGLGEGVGLEEGGGLGKVALGVASPLGNPHGEPSEQAAHRDGRSSVAGDRAHRRRGGGTREHNPAADGRRLVGRKARHHELVRERAQRVQRLAAEPKRPHGEDLRVVVDL